MVVFDVAGVTYLTRWCGFFLGRRRKKGDVRRAPDKLTNAYCMYSQLRGSPFELSLRMQEDEYWKLLMTSWKQICLWLCEGSGL